MAEMTTLVSAIYRKYTTTTSGDFSTVSPGITGRYEVFYDEGCSGMRVCCFYSLQLQLPNTRVHTYGEQEHECQIDFTPQAAAAS